MCSRYQSDEKRLIERYGLTPAPNIGPIDRPSLDRPGGNEVRPTDPALIIATWGAADIKTWGLDVSWQASPLINARAETLTEKPTFRNLLSQRCLVPATSYFEWRREGTRKIKTEIKTEDGDTCLFAGLFAGSRFVICTCVPAPSIAHIHNRMPVILTEQQARRWIDRDLAFGDVAGDLLPYAGRLSYADAAQDPAKSAQMSLF